MPSFPVSPKTPAFIRRAGGFTLIELLVVLAIIGVLGSILMPVLGRARQAAAVARAIADLRTIGLGVMAYTNDNNKILPALADLTESGGFGTNYWTVQIAPYVSPKVKGEAISFENKALTISPSFLSPLLKDGQHHMIADYGANRDVLVKGTGRRLMEITRPSRTILVAPAETRASIALPNGCWFFETFDYVADPKKKTQTPSDHGTGKILAVFVDGHVEQFSRAEFEANRRDLLLVNP